MAPPHPIFSFKKKGNQPERRRTVFFEKKAGTEKTPRLERVGKRGVQKWDKREKNPSTMRE